MMIGFKQFQIKKNERAVLLRNGDFERFLSPGKHNFFSGFDHLTVACANIKQAWFDHELAEYLLASEPAVVAREFTSVCLSDTQVALVFENQILIEVLSPATRRLYWKDQVIIEVLNVTQVESLSSELKARINRNQINKCPVYTSSAITVAQIDEYHAGLLVVNGKVQTLLEPGLHAFWKVGHQIDVKTIDLRTQSLEVSGQEILTKDKVSLRLNLIANWRFEDVLKAHSQFSKPAEQVYRELQLGLRMAVGTRSLDELLENKQSIDQIVREFAGQKLAQAGMVLETLGVKDIILPGEMKLILAQVVEAEKSAQANVIRRREETAATRSLLNTAKLMEDNPIALRMKELETLERVAERIDKISVFGGLDQVLNGLVKLK
jgi:regulator of protease activity HflC (stomatin/prohibitin superfamily)